MFEELDKAKGMEETAMEEEEYRLKAGAGAGEGDD